MTVINPSFLRFFFPWILWKGPDDGRDVFLTFDDGPRPDFTPGILDILKTEGIQASFFLTGRNLILYPGIVERMKREGHTIGNHGFSHVSLGLKKTDWIRLEIERTDQALEKITGEKPYFFRPPYGRFDHRFRRLMRETGHRLVLWSLLSLDYREGNSKALIARVQNRMHPGAVIVFHDGHENGAVTMRVLADLIRGLKNAYYRPLALNTLRG